MSAPRVSVTFQISRPGAPLRVETITSEVIKIGRLASSHLVLDDESVGRMHAVLEVRGPNDVHLIDLGSPRGTLVNGRCESRVRLHGGDRLVMGEVALTVAFAPAEAPRVAPPPVPVAAPMFTAVTPPPAPVAAPMFTAVTPPVAVAAPMFTGVTRGPIGDDPSEVRGSSAVEVVTLFEDAIVDTRHLSDPSPNRARASTVALIAGGAASLAIAFGMFVVSYAAAARGAGSPTSSGILGDLIVALLLGGGAVAFVAGLLRRGDERRPRHFTIGTDPRAQANVAAVAGAFPLVRATGQSFELLFTAAMAGDLTRDGECAPLSDLIAAGRAPESDLPGAHALPILDGTRARIDFGPTSFVIAAGRAPRRYPVPLRLDRAALAYYGGTFAACAIFLALIFSLPPSRSTLALDETPGGYRLGKFIFKPKQEEDPLAKLRPTGKETGASGVKAGAMAGQAGKMGNTKSKNHDGKFAIKGDPSVIDPHLAAKNAADLAGKVGVLGILRSDEGSIFSSILSRDRSALGQDADSVMGNLYGTQTADAYGAGGYDLVGSGPGGGGAGINTIGVGPGIGIGHGGGGGDGKYGVGPGIGSNLVHKAKAPETYSTAVTVTQGYGKDVVRRVVRQHLPEVKYCYEKELARSPNLYGRVVVQFTIAGMGQVVGSAIEKSTMNSRPVEACISDAVKRWSFPKPPAGIVQVSYPFTLRAAGQGDGE